MRPSRELAATLDVESTLDTTTVVLGPARRTLRWRGFALMGVGIAGGWVVGPLLGPVAASVGSLAVAAVGAALRVRDWSREEAPLRIELRRHELALHRVYQGRLLHASTVSLARLRQVAARGDAVLLTLDDATSVALVAGYRTGAELESVAAWIQSRADAEGDVADDAALARLRAAAVQGP